jgi:hypothetical protein
MTQRYRDVLDHETGARIFVEFTTERREVSDYVVVLTVPDGDQDATVRVYDATHGINEMHRHDHIDGKKAGQVFHRGTLGEGMRAAIAAVRDGHEEMIEAWRAN